MASLFLMMYNEKRGGYHRHKAILTRLAAVSNARELGGVFELPTPKKFQRLPENSSSQLDVVFKAGESELGWLVNLQQPVPDV